MLVEPRGIINTGDIESDLTAKNDQWIQLKMITSIDHLIIAVENLEEAESNYTKILGIPSSWKGEHKDFGTSNCLFNFKNT